MLAVEAPLGCCPGELLVTTVNHVISLGPNFGEIIPLTFRCHHKFSGHWRSKSNSGFCLYFR